MTIASPFQIPAREPLIDARTGLISRPWYLFLQNLIRLALPDSGVTVDDLAVQQLFDNDNTSQVAAIQNQVDNIVIDIDAAGASPFETTGTVRYVNATAPSGVLGVSGVPYQNSGAIALAWSGTSGGVPFFDGASSMDSSAELVQYGVVVGGGAGAAPATIAAGTDNQFLAGNTGGDPSFRSIDLSTADVTGVLAVTNGGTGLNSASQGDLVYGSAVNTYAHLAKDTNATRYLSNTGSSNNPAWAQVDLSNGVTGNLPIAHLDGGTGAGASTYWRGDASWSDPLSGGQNVTIVTAQLTGGGSQGSMTFTNGILTASTPAT